ncbi:MAG: histidinol-phosphate transaminase [Fusobacteriia bacterium 4572_132]|nr:MAG: histidinol-phosphate transaminase [Fusobacteriia bacterium 4572_132]
MRNKVRQGILDLSPYVPGKGIEEVKRENGLDKVIKIASNENPLGTSKKVIEAIRTFDNLSTYPDGSAYNLRKKLSEIYEIDADKFIFGDGTDEVISMLFLTFMESGDEVIFAEPSFAEYERYAKISGATPIKIPLDVEFKHDLEAMKKAITSKTKMIIICNPNNPTGTMIDKKEMDTFLEEVPSDIIVAIDEAYFDYAAIFEEYPNSMDYQDKYKNVVTLRTFSKAYGLAGLRVGFGIADKEIVNLMERIRLPFNVTVPSLVGAIAALDDMEHIQKSVKLNEEGKKYLYSELDKLDLKYVKTYANYIYIDMKEEGQKVFEALLKKGVIIRAMKGNFIRVTVGTMEESRLFIEKLKEWKNK